MKKKEKTFEVSEKDLLYAAVNVVAFLAAIVWATLDFLVETSLLVFQDDSITIIPGIDALAMGFVLIRLFVMIPGFIILLIVLYTDVNWIAGKHYQYYRKGYL